MKRFFSAPLASNPQEERQTNPVLPFLSFFSKKLDWMQILPMLALLAIGAQFIYGTGQQVGGIHASVIWKRQLLYIGIGFAVWFFFLFFDYRWLAPASIILYPLSILLLVLVLFFGKELFGARRWFSIGGVSIQPSEFSKLCVILAVSWVLSFRKADINRFLWAAGVLLLTALPFALIYKEPDLGSALVLLPAVGAIVFTARQKLRWILLFIILITAAAPVVYYHLKPYQRERIQTFLDPESDPQNRGWNAIQAELAVGRGGISGKGFMQGTHCSLGYLPTTVANSDFIFPVIAEETGFIGTITLLCLYALLLFSILRTAWIAPDPFGRYLCVGIGALLTFHVIVNIGMCIQLLPITGLPLPLVSYGGSFLIAMLTYLGIVQSVYAHRKQASFVSF